MIRRPPPAILVLAAGASSRMRGVDKLLEPVDGMPLLLRAARAALRAAPDVIVGLPAGNRIHRAWLADLPVRVVEVAERAMSATVRAGVAACRSDALLLHLADMPEIEADDLSAVVTAWQASDAAILRATAADGTPGHPVCFARSLFPALAALRGDDGARAVLRGRDVMRVPLPGRRALLDLDTPEAWIEWREATGR